MCVNLSTLVKAITINSNTYLLRSIQCINSIGHVQNYFGWVRSNLPIGSVNTWWNVTSGEKLDKPAMRLIRWHTLWKSIWMPIFNSDVNDTKLCNEYSNSWQLHRQPIISQKCLQDQFSVSFTSQWVIFNSPWPMQESLFIAIKNTCIHEGSK